MPVNKPHLEFHRLDMSSGWSTPPGYPTGIEQKILAGTLDEERRSGSRTRLLRFAPGVFTTAPFVHEYWEEVYLIEGDLTVGNDDAGRGGESFQRALTPAVRPARCTARSSRKADAFSTRSTISPNNGKARLRRHRLAQKKTRPRPDNFPFWAGLLPEPEGRRVAFNR